MEFTHKRGEMIVEKVENAGYFGLLWIFPFPPKFSKAVLSGSLKHVSVKQTDEQTNELFLYSD